MSKTRVRTAEGSEGKGDRPAETGLTALLSGAGSLAGHVMVSAGSGM